MWSHMFGACVMSPSELQLCFHNQNLWLFVFKQKTAYKLRISDWSSDVCSSDLRAFAAPSIWSRSNVMPRRSSKSFLATERWQASAPARWAYSALVEGRGKRDRTPRYVEQRSSRPDRRGISPCGGRPHRSAEHKSELQSQIGKSNAVVCLQK